MEGAGGAGAAVIRLTEGGLPTAVEAAAPPPVAGGATISSRYAAYDVD